jgi:hypothetical protein
LIRKGDFVVEEKGKGPRKPTGQLGGVHIGRDGVSHRPTELPEAKEDIERSIVERVFGSDKPIVDRTYQHVEPPTQNPQNSFDFTIRTVSGDEFLELMEVAPLDTIGGTFETAPRAFIQGELVNAVWGQIAKKARKYGRRNEATIHLLLYCTDRRFFLPPSFWLLVSSVAAREPHPFKTIVFAEPKSDGGAYIEVILPVSPDMLKGSDEARERSKQLVSARLTDGIVTSNGERTRIAFPLGKHLARLHSRRQSETE